MKRPRALYFRGPASTRPNVFIAAIPNAPLPRLSKGELFSVETLLGQKRAELLQSMEKFREKLSEEHPGYASTEVEENGAHQELLDNLWAAADHDAGQLRIVDGALLLLRNPITRASFDLCGVCRDPMGLDYLLSVPTARTHPWCNGKRPKPSLS